MAPQLAVCSGTPTLHPAELSAGLKGARLGSRSRSEARKCCIGFHLKHETKAPWFRDTQNRESFVSMRVSSRPDGSNEGLADGPDGKDWEGDAGYKVEDVPKKRSKKGHKKLQKGVRSTFDQVEERERRELVYEPTKLEAGKATPEVEKGRAGREIVEPGVKKEREREAEGREGGMQREAGTNAEGTTADNDSGVYIPFSWQTRAIVGLAALASVGSLFAAGPAVVEALSWSQSRPSQGAEYSQAVGASRVERILAQQLAKR
jgi:hypothetical protein